MAAGIHARYPEFNPHDLLSDSVLEHYTDVTTKGCFYYGFATYAATPRGTLLRPKWEKSVWIHRFFDGNQVANAPIGGPLFVIAGEADQTVPIAGVRAAVKKMCAKNQPVTFLSYPGLDHDPAMEQLDAGSARMDQGAICGNTGGVELPRRRRLVRRAQGQSSSETLRRARRRR